MALQDDITEGLKEAMKSKNTIALEALRSIKSALLLLKSEDRTKEVSEEDEIKILQKLVKQRKESAEIFITQNRNDLAETELAQCKIIETFLPKQLTDEEVTEVIKTTIVKTGASSIKNMGMIIGLVTKDLAGKAESRTIANITKQLLS